MFFSLSLVYFLFASNFIIEIIAYFHYHLQDKILLFVKNLLRLWLLLDRGNVFVPLPVLQMLLELFDVPANLLEDLSERIHVKFFC